jgi:hypothetical protein
MKRSLPIFLALLPCLAFAEVKQDNPASGSTAAPGSEANPHHMFNPERQLARLTTILGLTIVQQGQIRPLLISRADRLKAINGSTTLSEVQKRQQIMVVRKSTLQQIERFLNPAQIVQFKALHNQRKQ